MVESADSWDERMSTYIMYALLVFYLAILVAALFERNYWRALYWIGAMLITISILGMDRSAIPGTKTPIQESDLTTKVEPIH